MTQVAQKYKNDGAKLDNALANITKEGNYLLVLINSILDVNQLELMSPASNTPDSIADRSACLSLPSALLILK